MDEGFRPINDDMVISAYVWVGVLLFIFAFAGLAVGAKTSGYVWGAASIFSIFGLARTLYRMYGE